MKILVTGATGFIGNHVIERLLLTDHEIMATSANENNPKQRSWHDRVEYQPYNLYQPRDQLFQFFKEPDLMIHLAWDHLDDFKSELHLKKILPAHCRFISTMVAEGLSKLTVTGTCLEYGLQEGALNENMDGAPVVFYATAKDVLRRFIFELQSHYSFNLTWLRLFYVFGKGQQEKSVLQQLEKAIENGEREFNMSEGEQWRDYLPVEIMADYIVRVALSQAKNEIVNCCSGYPVSIKELVDFYLEKRGVKMKLNTGVYPYPDYEPFRFWGDDTKLKKITGEKE